jgi:hypothetical protein
MGSGAKSVLEKRTPNLIETEPQNACASLARVQVVNAHSNLQSSAALIDNFRQRWSSSPL